MGFSKSLASELVPEGVMVTLVAAGGTPTQGTSL